MIIKKDFILRKIAGEDVVVPIGQNIINFNGVITLNETAAFLWKELKNDCSKDTLKIKMCQEYDVTEEKAQEDIDKFLAVLKEHHILEDV